jgi:hypothetical protein
LGGGKDNYRGYSGEVNIVNSVSKLCNNKAFDYPGLEKLLKKSYMTAWSDLQEHGSAKSLLNSPNIKNKKISKIEIVQ